MFKLFMIQPDLFKVIDNAGQVDCTGTLEEAKEMMKALGASDDSINEALTSLAANKHNTADFGFNIKDGSAGFTFSSNCVLTYRNRLEAVFTLAPTAVKVA